MSTLYRFVSRGRYPEATPTYKERSPINSVDKFSVPVALFQVSTANCIIIDPFSAFEPGLVAPFLYAA
jgi:hypothetical protein